MSAGCALVGWGVDDVQEAFKLRFDDADKVIYMWPEDVITNTIRAFSVSATSATGYSGAAPEGRYFAPPERPSASRCRRAGECGGTARSLVVTGPLFQQTDLRVAKRTQIVGRRELRVRRRSVERVQQGELRSGSAPSTQHAVERLDG